MIQKFPLVFFGELMENLGNNQIISYLVGMSISAIQRTKDSLEKSICRRFSKSRRKEVSTIGCNKKLV